MYKIRILSKALDMGIGIKTDLYKIVQMNKA